MEARTFNPALHPHDPNTGKWMDTPDLLDDAWLAELLDLSGGPFQVGVDGNEWVTLGFDNPDGSRASLSLPLHEAQQFSRLITDQFDEDNDLSIGKAESIAHYGDDAGDQGYAQEFVELTRTGDDEYQLELATGDGTEIPETLGTTRLSSADLARLSGAIDRMSTARYSETSEGDFTTVMNQDGDLHTTWPASAGEPIDLTMPDDSADDIQQAINELVAAIEEFPIDDDGNPLLGPDDMVAQRTIQLGNTEFTISAFGQYGNGGYLTFESSAHDWFLKLGDTEAEQVSTALEESSGIAAEVNQERQAPPNHEVRGMSEAKSWTRRQRDTQASVTDRPAGLSADVRAAAAARGAATGGAAVARRSAPNGGERARALPFSAQLRATKRERNGQQMYNLVGIASVTDTRYEMWDMFGPYEEIIDRAAFTDTLAADPDVAFLVNHRGVTMARTRSRLEQPQAERTLFLSMVDEGLKSDAWLNPKRQDVSDLVVAIDDGNITEMSFAFMLEEGWWSEDFTTFRITKLDINRGDVSAVNYGANPYTSIAARSREILADLDHLPVGAARAALTRLRRREDLSPTRTTPQPADDAIAAIEAELTAPLPPETRATGRSIRHVEALLDI